MSKPKTRKAGRGVPQRYYYAVVLNYDGDDCLFWPYGRDSSGYGLMKRDGKQGVVSRFVCEDTNGPPPTPAHQAAHSCGKGSLGCVAKRHLSWKTPSENRQDMLIHGTHTRGENSKRAKLANEDARQILLMRGKESCESLAKRFGISPQAVSNIHNRRRWAWLSASMEASQ